VRSLYVLVSLLLIGCIDRKVSFSSLTPPSGDDVGNGGNPALVTWFKQAKEKTPASLRRLYQRLDAGWIPKSSLPQDVDWVKANLYRLESEILESPIVWTNEAQDRCGHTLASQTKWPIRLYHPKCLASVGSFLTAADVLIHENIHHLGYRDEETVEYYTARIMDWVGGQLLQDEAGVLDTQAQADFVCETDPPYEGNWKVAVEIFNGVMRVKMFRWENGSYVFHARYNCVPADAGAQRCGPVPSPDGTIEAYVDDFKRVGGMNFVRVVQWNGLRMDVLDTAVCKLPSR